jgi:hypothetical protein
LICRVTLEELEHFDGEVARRGVASRQALMREQLGSLLGSSAAVTGSTGPELPPRPAEAVTAPEVASEGGWLPDARWISNRSGGEVSYAKAQAALDRGEVSWVGSRIKVGERVF